MSGMLNKVKDALTGDKNTHEGHTGGAYDNDRSTGSGLGSGSGYDNTSSGRTGGLGSSGYGDNTSSGLTGSGSGYDNDRSTGSGLGSGAGYDNDRTSGPHSSDLANKADPRVDSDRDGSRGYGSGTTGSGLGSGTGYDNDRSTGSGLGSGTGYDNDRTSGPHSSNLANKADPRVDSDRDGSRGYGSGTTGSGLGSGTGYDNDRSTGSGGYGSGGQSGHGRVEDIVHGGEHHTQTANKLDPHVSGGGMTGTESAGSGYGTSGMGSTGSGYGDNTGYDNTTGKKPGMMDKLNPMKDTDHDGKKGFME